MSMHLFRDTMQHDEAFLSLLSSQRELLTQLNMEHAMRRTEQMGLAASANARFGPRLAGQEGLTNRSIGETRFADHRRPSMDMLLSKRFSLGFGMGFDSYSLPAFHMDPEPDSEHSGDKKHKVEEMLDRSTSGKKRRMSSLGFVSPSFFEDHLQLDRRGSLVLGFDPKAEKVTEVVVDGDADSDDDDDDDKEEDDEASLEPLDFKQSKVDPDLVKTVMEAFNKAMEKSQISQQSIHDWDRKMGLKRSHSKTMRLSSRSRKKLRSVLKKEINAIATKI